MRAILFLGTAALGALAIQWFLSHGRKPALIAGPLDEKLHQLQGKFKSLDEVQYEAVTTSSGNLGYPESLHPPAQP